MAKTKLQAMFTTLRGRVGDVIFKQYAYGTVVTRLPRMGKVKWSPAQVAHRKRVKEAAKFYRDVLADPVRLKTFRAIAAKKKLPLSAVTLQHFLKATAKPGSP